MPLFKLLPGILKAVGSVLGIDVVSKAGDALASTQLSPEKQAELQSALLEHEAKMRELNIEEMRTALSESLAMLTSTDKYVSRARPTGLYLFYGATAILVVAHVFGVKVDPTAVLTMLAPLGGVAGTYVFRRTTEKLNGNGAAG